MYIPNCKYFILQVKSSHSSGKAARSGSSEKDYQMSSKRAFSPIRFPKKIEIDIDEDRNNRDSESKAHYSAATRDFPSERISRDPRLQNFSSEKRSSNRSLSPHKPISDGREKYLQDQHWAKSRVNTPYLSSRLNSRKCFNHVFGYEDNRSRSRSNEFYRSRSREFRRSPESFRYKGYQPYPKRSSPRQDKRNSGYSLKKYPRSPTHKTSLEYYTERGSSRQQYDSHASISSLKKNIYHFLPEQLGASHQHIQDSRHEISFEIPPPPNLSPIESNHIYDKLQTSLPQLLRIQTEIPRAPPSRMSCYNPGDSKVAHPESSAPTEIYSKLRRKSLHQDRSLSNDIKDAFMHPKFEERKSIAKNLSQDIPTSSSKLVEIKEQMPSKPAEVSNPCPASKKNLTNPAKDLKTYKIPKIQKGPHSPASSARLTISANAASSLKNVKDSHGKRPEDIVKQLEKVLGTVEFEKVKSIIVKDAAGDASVEKLSENAVQTKSKVKSKRQSSQSNSLQTDVIQPRQPSNSKVSSKSVKQKSASAQPSDQGKSSKKYKANPNLKKTSPKKRSYRKLNELDRLHMDISEMFDREGVVNANGPRSCTQAGKQKYDEIEQNLRTKFNIRKSYVLLERIDYKNDKRAKTLNHQLSVNRPELDHLSISVDSHSEENELMSSNLHIKAKEHLNNLNIDNYIPQQTAAKTRKRASWSRGIIQKKTKKLKSLNRNIDSNDDWEDLEKDEPEKSDKNEKLIKLSELVDFMNSFKTSQKPANDSLNIANPDNKPSKKGMGSFSFVNSQNGMIFKCELCYFESIQKNHFIQHIKSRHRLISWSKFCRICNKTFEEAEASLVGEFKHFVIHVPETLEAVVIGDQHAMMLPVAEVKPMLKIRSLPGDKLSKPINLFEISQPKILRSEAIAKPTQNVVGTLSTVKLTQESAAPQSINLSQLVSANNLLEINTVLLKRPTPQSQEEGGSPKIKESFFTQPLFVSLRPWISIKEVKGRNKSKNACDEMLADRNCLAALFKCMGSDCTFYTSDKPLFVRHLELHHEYQNQDNENYMSCAYCIFTSNSIQNLTNHITEVHGFDRFACCYCFYRAYSDFHIFHQHLIKHHAIYGKSVISCEAVLKRNTRMELMAIRRSIVKHIPKLECICKLYIIFIFLFFSKKIKSVLGCKEVFYVFKQYQDHLEGHGEKLSTRCTKCKEAATKSSIVKHLCSCFNFGLYQCVYCQFGSNAFDVIDNHIAENHSSYMAIFCQRSSPTSKILKPSVSFSNNFLSTFKR